MRAATGASRGSKLAPFLNCPIDCISLSVHTRYKVTLACLLYGTKSHRAQRALASLRKFC